MSVLEIDPTSTRYNEFIPLLEEKVSNGKFPCMGMLHGMNVVHLPVNLVFNQT